jgi:hypothetical protein
MVQMKVTVGTICWSCKQRFTYYLGEMKPDFCSEGCNQSFNTLPNEYKEQIKMINNTSDVYKKTLRKRVFGEKSDNYLH